MRNRDLPLPPIRIFAESVLQLLQTSLGTDGTIGKETMEEVDQLYDNLDKTGFVNEEANQRLAKDVWLDLVTNSSALRHMKSLLKAIIRGYELIEAFYRNAGISFFVHRRLTVKLTSCNIPLIQNFPWSAEAAELRSRASSTVVNSAIHV